MAARYTAEKLAERAAKRKVYSAANRAALSAAHKAWVDKNREHVRAHWRDRYRLHPERMSLRRRANTYGISPDEQRALLASQGGACAICRCDLAFPCSKDTHLDHDHETGEVRGFLCRDCNHLIAKAKDSPARLRAAAAYLDRRQPKLRLVR